MDRYRHLVLLAVLFVSACSTNRYWDLSKINISENYLLEEDDGYGIVFLTTGMSANSAFLDSASFYYDKSDKKVQGLFPIVSNASSQDFVGDNNGTLIVRRLPVGSYHVTQWEWTRGDVRESAFFYYPFEVKNNTITYLGSLYVELDGKKRALKITNKFDRDRHAFKKKLPKLPLNSIEISLLR